MDGLPFLMFSVVFANISIMQPRTERVFLCLAAVSAALGIAAGAFGAHALKGRIGLEMGIVFETAVRYQMYHALGLMGVAWAWTRWPNPAVRAAGWLFIVGTVLFSGSLYLLSLTGIRWLGMITPVGGIALIAGWASLAWACIAK